MLAVTTDAGRYFRTVSVWDERAKRLMPVISIEDADPESGRAFRYAWSQDSKALLIFGWGAPLDAEVTKVVQRRRVCFVFKPENEAFLEISPCERTRWAH